MIVWEPFNFNCDHGFLLCSLQEDGRGCVAQLHRHIKSFLRVIMDFAGLSKWPDSTTLRFSSAFCFIYWNYNLPRWRDWKENGFLKCPAHPAVFVGKVFNHAGDNHTWQDNHSHSHQRFSCPLSCHSGPIVLWNKRGLKTSRKPGEKQRAVGMSR